MKKRRKDDEDSCLVQFVKTILLLACVYWGLITAMRTVDDSWWLIGGIAVVSYLLVKLFKDDDYVSRHSWASIAKTKNISIGIISEAMGHDSETTTQIYLSSIQTNQIDNANRNILKDL